jgi:ribosomal protein L11 methyltransferase
VNTSQSDQTVLTITDLDRDAAYVAADALTELIEPAAAAVSIFEDGTQFRIDAYYDDASTAQTVLDVLGDQFADTAAKAALAPVAQENWVALSQAALPPVIAGRFTICGSHDLDRVPLGPNTIIVEAGEAFGTAHHATTYGCLLAIDRMARRARYGNVLDLGTGSGILALAMTRAFPHASIIATDIDARSIEVAHANAERNGLGRLSGGPHFLMADGLDDNRIQRKGPFDLIVANILAGPLIAMAADICGQLGDGATLVLSGILVPQAREVCARYKSFDLELQRHERHNGWSTLVFQKRGRKPSASRRYNLYMPSPSDD